MSNSNGNIGGTNDLPNFEMGQAADGVSVARSDTLKSLTAEFERSLDVLASKINDAERAREALLSGVALLEKVVDQVVGAIEIHQARRVRPEAASAARPLRRQDVLAGALDVLRAPAEQRGATLTRVAEMLLMR